MPVVDPVRRKGARALIDPRAIIDPSARISDDVEIGPWTIVGPDVEIGDGCSIASHVVLNGPTRLGRNNRIFQFATVGDATPAVVYKGEPTWLVVGDNNIIREGVTMHRGTVQDQGKTVIGDNNLLMAYVHVAHDCVVGDHVIMANNAGLGGHVEVGDWANFGGFAEVPPRRSIGAHAMIGGMSLVLKDVPAFVSVSRNPASAVGINVIGLKRRGYSDEVIRTLKEAYRMVYRSGLSLEQAIERLRGCAAQCSEVQAFVESIARSSVGIVRGRKGAERE
ncbi:MAG: acyl-ACP--UDP-N-acetylglucosamine O-acyltransferase [Pseudomonadales bacterium]